MVAKSTRLNFEAAHVFRFFFDLPVTCKKAIRLLGVSTSGFGSQRG